MIIGIDFGTCFSTVAIMNGSLPVSDYIEGDSDKTGMPTLFMYSKDLRKELYGFECKSAAIIGHQADVVRYIKKTIRENPNNLNTTIISGGMSYTINDIVKKYLKYLLAQAKSGAEQSNEFRNTDFEYVTITAPVGISEGQMTATDYNKLLVDTITEITGLTKDRVNVIQEPVAAAISYLYSEGTRKNFVDKQSILVFDLGGGTLDVTVVEYNPSTKEYNIKVKEGDLNLGGINWDEALGKAVLKKVDCSESFVDEEEKADFKSRVNRLKHHLTSSDDDYIAFKRNYVSKFTPFTRSEFESVTKNLLDRAIEVTKKAIRSYSSNGVSAIDKIVLVGGSSNMPQIRERMVSEFWRLGEERILLHDPSKAIAKGAAIFAKMESKKSFEDSTTQKIKVNDIATHTYGFDAIKSGINKDMIYNLLFKGTQFDENGKIVVKSATSFVPAKDSQTQISWTVYESDKEKGSEKDYNWMSFGSNENKNGMKVTVQVPPEYLGKASSFSTWVTFSLDINGILEIIITDKDGNRVGYDKKQI